MITINSSRAMRFAILDTSVGDLRVWHHRRVIDIWDYDANDWTWFDQDKLDEQDLQAVYSAAREAIQQMGVLS